jgi:hypothetical protein
LRGKVVEDDCRRYFVALPSDQIYQLRHLLEQARTELFDQTVIYFSEGRFVEMLPPLDDDSEGR